MLTAPAHLVPTLRQLVAIGPHAGAHRVALRLALSTTVPLLVLWHLGRVDLVPYAFLPATAAVFGRNAPGRRKVVMQAQVSSVLIGLVVVGAVCAAFGVPVGMIVVMTAVVAGACSVTGDLLGWSPAGSLFFVFAFVASASAPVSLSTLPLIAATCTVVGFGTMAITASGLVPAVVRPPQRRTAVKIGRDMTDPVLPRRIAFVHGVGSAVAVGVAGAITWADGSQHPYWAMVSAIVPIAGGSTAGQLTRATHRIAGTVAGLAVTAVVLTVATTPLAMIIALVLCVTVAELLIARNYALATLFVTPATIGMLTLNHPQPLVPLLAARVSETCIGVAVAFVVVIATHAVRHPQAQTNETTALAWRRPQTTHAPTEDGMEGFRSRSSSPGK
uniref:Integral membrane bound transporter domain-containing protein n=1 Tax=Rhodococcus sp. NS1 TaxID=402236 RepID=A0A097SQW8_9NOCA|nr:hypothetical protein LRS1606.504 [Rhodococcus sp. NS1]